MIMRNFRVLPPKDDVEEIEEVLTEEEVVEEVC